ncbi:hypothetical protein GALL_145370 [mine drainage metagenome]|uniref:ABM domain-containing protein n=1 Tax=mine drainage metagenome TaxID=410659 RepID=A0A1J5S492_9ZZZZ
MSDTLVIMQFRLQKDKTTADWLQANQLVNDWIKQQPGFRFRSLSETVDGVWFIVVYWASMEAAKAAEASFGQSMAGLIVPFVEMSGFTSSNSTAHLMQQGQDRG